MGSPFGKLKKVKPLHWLYNLLHYKELLHNKKALEKYHINKPLFATISSKDFPDKESKAWLDVGDWAVIASQKQEFLNFPQNIQKKIIDWSSNGYMVLENFFSAFRRFSIKSCS